MLDLCSEFLCDRDCENKTKKAYQIYLNVVEVTATYNRHIFLTIFVRLSDKTFEDRVSMIFSYDSQHASIE